MLWAALSACLSSPVPREQQRRSCPLHVHTFPSWSSVSVWGESCLPNASDFGKLKQVGNPFSFLRIIFLDELHWGSGRKNAGQNWSALLRRTLNNGNGLNHRTVILNLTADIWMINRDFCSLPTPALTSNQEYVPLFALTHTCWLSQVWTLEYMDCLAGPDCTAPCTRHIWSAFRWPRANSPTLKLMVKLPLVQFPKCICGAREQQIYLRE